MLQNAQKVFIDFCFFYFVKKYEKENEGSLRKLTKWIPIHEIIVTIANAGFLPRDAAFCKKMASASSWAVQPLGPAICWADKAAWFSHMHLWHLVNKHINGHLVGMTVFYVICLTTEPLPYTVAG